MALPAIAQGLDLVIDPFCAFAYWGVEVKGGIITTPLQSSLQLTDGGGW